MHAMIFWIWLFVVGLIIGISLMGYLLISGVLEWNLIKIGFGALVGVIVLPKMFSVIRG